MARYSPLSRINRDEKLINSEENKLSQSENLIFQFDENLCSQPRIRRSACSDLQSITIPEERLINLNYRRSSLFNDHSKNISLNNNNLSSDNDYFKLCRQRCKSFYKSFKIKKNNRDENNEKINIKKLSKITYRYSLPDASTSTFQIKNILKRNKTTKYNKIHFDLSQSLLTNSSSTTKSTFRNFLCLVKSTSNNKSMNLTKFHHSSLTTLTNINDESLTDLNETMFSIPLTIQWHFQEENGQWISLDRMNKINLGSIELHNLTFIEQTQLKRIVFERLQSSKYDLDVSFQIPKDEPTRKRKHNFMFRSKSTDKSKENKERKSYGNIFGVALSECVNNEDFYIENKNKSQSTIINSNKISSRNERKYSISPSNQQFLDLFDNNSQEIKYRSLSLEALKLNENNISINRINTLRCYPAKVPELIKYCCDYLEKNGLQTVGLFRVGVSKKRLKELKDQINSNHYLKFDCSTNVHDIAGLIKEFLRELPEPLLTKDLSRSFLNIRTKVNEKDQFRFLSYLIYLLPSSNRDTLYTLLKFLNNVSLNSQDLYSSDGKLLLIGNKMDTENLSIIFAPTIFIDFKTSIISNKDINLSTSTDYMEQAKIILKQMIEQYKHLFNIPKDLHNEILISLNEINSDFLIRLLAFKLQKGCGLNSIELDSRNKNLFMTLDLKSILFEKIPRKFQEDKLKTHRYYLRRNSDFPYFSSNSSNNRLNLSLTSITNQIKSYSNSKTFQTSSLFVQDESSISNKFQAKDLCGSSSNENFILF